MFSPNDFDIVDLSVTLDNNPHTDPPPLLPKIDYMDHQEGWPEMEAMFPGLTLDQLPGNESWAAERLQITTHSGTHMDAPWHYASTTDGGKPAFGIDEFIMSCTSPLITLNKRGTDVILNFLLSSGDWSILIIIIATLVGNSLTSFANNGFIL